jgi:hypothetical protein
MANFFAIINGARNAPKADARLDLSIDTAATGGGPVNIEVFVYHDVDGVQLAMFNIPTNAQGFASTAGNNLFRNLFRASARRTALVKAVTPAGVPAAMAYLRQTGRAGKIILGVPPIKRNDNSTLACGTHFAVALGDYAKATRLLIANVTAVPIGVDLFLGTQGARGQGAYTNPALQPNAVWTVNFQSSDAQSHMVIVGTDMMIMHLAVDDGRMVHEASVLPT